MSSPTQQALLMAAGLPSGPAGVTGVIGWYDASVFGSLTLAGANINAIADQSGHGNNLTAVGTNPTYNATGFNTSFPAMIIGASNSALSSGAFPMGTGNTLTVWLVGHFNNTSASYGRGVSYASSAQIGLGHNDSDNNEGWLFAREAATTNAVLYRNVVIAHALFGAYGTPHRMIGTINSSGVMTIYIDGVATTGSTLNAAFGTPGQLVLGNVLSAGNAAWNGAIAEAGISTDFSNSTTITSLDTLLKSKWGL